jgi:transposase
MARRPRRNHSGEFKARVALAAIRGDKTLAEIAEHFEVHPHQVTEWKKQLLERAGEVFGGPSRKDEPPVDVSVANSQYEGIRLCGAVLRALAVMVRFAPCANSSSSPSTCWSPS